ncbi:MAG TPA: hypothetical protein VFX86_04975 [Candidatus Saccharimonadales bacterium]|nr:hypothetical protein [Candidatus Saccharimonadales bacterium]
MAGDSKDTIYIDIDEEITGIINKVQNSSKDIVALVLPKRASVLQSIVNMKLLKRAQDQSKKKVVLITSESRILPLAGAVGLFVASNLTSKPYVPPVPKSGTAPPKPEAEDKIDPNTPVSEVAPDAKFADSDGIEIDNTPKPKEDAAAGADKKKKSKKPKVPNFSRFRKKMLLIGLAVLLLIFAVVYGLFIAPKAKVTLRAQTNELPVDLGFIADTQAADFDAEEGIVRALSKEEKTDDSEKVNTSGEKNKGKKASGEISLNAGTCSANVPKSVPAGTGVSTKGITFITQQTASFQPDISSGTCYYTSSSDIVAQNPGANANVSGANFSVAGRSDVSGQGSASGGTDRIVKVVTQTDVDKAKERLNGKPNTAHDDFVAELRKDGFIPIEESFKVTPSNYDVTPNINAEGDQVTVSVTNTYTMLGIKEDDLKELVKKEVESRDEGKGQSILSHGFDDASIKFTDATAILDEGQRSLTIDTKVIVGPDLNQDNLKQQIAGKKSGEAENILGQIPGVNDPKVELSPFWVSKVPSNHSKINIEIQQANGNEIP